MTNLWTMRAQGGGPSGVDAAEVYRALSVLADPDHGVELRGLPSGRHRILPGDDLDGLAAAADSLGDGAGVYYCLNPIPADLDHSARVGDVIRRRWLLVDADPVKAEKDASATDQEKQAAFDLGETVYQHLRSLGWPDPVKVDSGNGLHLLYRIDLPNTADARLLLRGVLYALAGQFDGDGAKIDRAVHNASRIAKLPGTWARKGTSTDDRPHRMCRLLDVPEAVVVVASDLLVLAANPTAPPSAAETVVDSPFVLRVAPESSGYAEVALEAEVARILGSIEGGRNNSLNRAAFSLGQLVGGAALARDEVERQLRAAAISVGLDADETDKTLASGIEAGLAQPRTVPEPAPNDTAAPPAKPKQTVPDPWDQPVPFHDPARPAFPMRCLPGWLASFVEAEAVATQTPPDAAAVLALTFCGAALARKVRIRARDGWAEPTNLYSVVVLPPGNRKSAVFADLLAPVQQHEREEADRIRPLVAEKASARRVLEARLKNAEATAARATDQGKKLTADREVAELARELAEKPVPKATQLFVDDCTPEKLAQLLAEQNGRLLVTSAEGTVFEIARGRYSESPNFDIFLKGHSGDPIRVHRVGREPDSIDLPALSLAVTVQPDVVAGLGAEASLKGRGFTARFLYSLPPSLMGRRKIAQPSVPASLAATYRDCLLALWRMPLTAGAFGLGTTWFNFDPTARQELHEFEARLEPRLGPDGDLATVADWAGKLAGAAVRLAGIIHAAVHVTGDAPIPPGITRDVVEAAVALAEGYFLPHALAAYALLGSDPRIDGARKLVAWLQRKKPKDGLFSRRDAYRENRATFNRPEDVDPVLEILVRHGHIRERPRPWGTGPGRRPSPSFEANPYLFQSYTYTGHNAQFDTNETPV